MNPKTWRELWWVSFIVLVVWTVNGTLIFFLLSRIDSIVNVQLYNYGLQFSKQWADPYWASTNLITIFLVVPIALSVVVFVLGFSMFRRRILSVVSGKKTRPTEVQAEEKDSAITVEVEPEPEAQPESAKALQLEVLQPIQPEVINVDQNCVEATEAVVSEEPKVKEEGGLVIACPSCGKVFNRPLVMLDFSNGTTRLVNICPFCNHILDEASDAKKNR